MVPNINKSTKITVNKIDADPRNNILKKIFLSLLNINANYVGKSKFFSNPWAEGLVEGDDEFNPENESRVVVNARIGYEWDVYGIYLVGSNI